MPKQFEHLSMSVGRDYAGRHGHYEFVVFGRDAGQEDGEVVVRQGGFKSPAAARRAGFKAAEPFRAPALI